MDLDASAENWWELIYDASELDEHKINEVIVKYYSFQGIPLFHLQNEFQVHY